MDIFEFIIALAVIYDIYSLLNDGLIISCYVFCFALIILYIVNKSINLSFVIIKNKIFNKEQTNKA